MHFYSFQYIFMKSTKFLIALIGLVTTLSFAKASSVRAGADVPVVNTLAAGFQPRLPPPPPRPRLPFSFHRHRVHHHVYHRRYHRRHYRRY